MPTSTPATLRLTAAKLAWTLAWTLGSGEGELYDKLMEYGFTWHSLVSIKWNKLHSFPSNVQAYFHVNLHEQGAGKINNCVGNKNDMLPFPTTENQ